MTATWSASRRWSGRRGCGLEEGANPRPAYPNKRITTQRRRCGDGLGLPKDRWAGLRLMRLQAEADEAPIGLRLTRQPRDAMRLPGISETALRHLSLATHKNCAQALPE